MAVSPVWRERTLLRRELCTTKKKPETTSDALSRAKIKRPLTADNDAKHDSSDEVPDRHGDHNASDRDIFQPKMLRYKYRENQNRT